MVTSRAHDPAADEASVTRSEERLDVSTVTEVAGRVRLTKRVVTEERTLTVTVRREELVVEHLDADGAVLLPDVRQEDDRGAPGGEHGTPATDPVLELLLSEEEVEVVTRVVPRERIRVYVDSVTELVDVDTALSREVVEVDEQAVTDGGAGSDAPSDPGSPDESQEAR